MKKIGCYLYNIIFWVSRTITISIFGICFFAVLNAKYIFSELFFSKILESSFHFSIVIHKFFDISTNPLILLKHSLFLGPNVDTKYNIFGFKYNMFKLFCSNSQNIDILIYAFISILLIYFAIKYIFKNKKLIFAVFLEVFSVYFFIYFFTNNLNFLLLSLISPIIFITLYFFNLYFPFKKILILFPVIGEIFCINSVILFITKKQQKEIVVLIISIIISSIIYIFIPYYNNNFKNLVIKNNSIYNIIFDNKQDRFITSSNPIFLVNSINNKGQAIKTKFDLYQDIAVNWAREELYIYDIRNGIFHIIDINTKKEKAKIKMLNFEDIKDRTVLTRFSYYAEKNILLIVFESKFGAFLIDLDNLKIVERYDKIFSPNDSAIYNKFRNSFILTYFQCSDTIQEISLKNNSINNMIVGSEQGYIAISERNKEVYIAFHQQGRIGVYDAETMELKRKIKSNYTVKDITYDEELNVLIAPSYFTGYIDIFLMDGSDKLLTRNFVGYELREARFDNKKENLYVCSHNGLYKIPINIKELIKKYKSVSHETLNYNL